MYVLLLQAFLMWPKPLLAGLSFLPTTKDVTSAILGVAGKTDKLSVILHLFRGHLKITEASFSAIDQTALLQLSTPHQQNEFACTSRIVKVAGFGGKLMTLTKKLCCNNKSGASHLYLCGTNTQRKKKEREEKEKET